MNIAYEKQGFENGQILTAEHLIRIEDELLDTQGVVDNITEGYAAKRNLCNIGNITFIRSTGNIPIGSGLEAGKTYTLSADVSSTDTDNDTCCFYLCTSENIQENTRRTIGRGERVSVSFVCPEMTAAINKICFYAAGNTTNSSDDTATFGNIQIEEGSAATTYIPYGGTIPTAVDQVARNKISEITECLVSKQPLPSYLSSSDFEQGSINEAGSNSTTMSRIRTTGYIDVSLFTSIIYDIPSGYRAYIVLFSTNSPGNSVDKSGWVTGSGEIVLPANAKFYRLQFASSSDSVALTVNDINLLSIRYGYKSANADIVEKTNWLAIGDSITRGVYSFMNGDSSDSDVTDGWVRRLAAALDYNITVMASRGMGYTAAVTGQDPVDSSLPRINLDELLTRVEALTDNFNLITLAFGINDYATPSSASLETITAGLDDAIVRLMTKFPTARLVVITPFNSCRNGDPSTNYAYNYERNGRSLKDIADTIRDRCALYGVECIYATNGFLINNYNITTLLPDNTHPSDYGHTLIAKNMAHYLLN